MITTTHRARQYIRQYIGLLILLRGESHIDFRTQSVLMTLGVVGGGGGVAGVGGGGAITNDALNFRKSIKFQSS